MTLVAPKSRVLVIVPTYNECHNIEPIYDPHVEGRVVCSSVDRG